MKPFGAGQLFLPLPSLGFFTRNFVELKLSELKKGRLSELKEMTKSLGSKPADWGLELRWAARHKCTERAHKLVYETCISPETVHLFQPLSKMAPDPKRV